jgi:hypothetical protein
MLLLYVLIACLSCGLGFVALATLLMSCKGNTIRDVLSAKNLKDANAIKIDILDKIKISSNIPIVGLFLVGALVAVVLPGYVAYIQAPSSASPPILVGSIRDYLQLVDGSKGERIYAFYPEMGIKGDGWFGIPLRNTGGPQSVVLESPNTNPLTLMLQIKPLENKVEVIADAFGDKSQVLTLDGTVVRLPQPLTVSRTTLPTKADVPNQPSRPPNVSAEFRAVPDIPRASE